ASSPSHSAGVASAATREATPQPSRRRALAVSRPHTLSAHEHRVLAATCLASLGSYYTMAVTGFALPQIQRGLAIPQARVGSVLAVSRCGTLSSLLLAVSADRRGRRRLLVGSVAGCALANVATAFAPSGAALAALQLVSRCFLGGQTLLASVVVSEELRAGHRGPRAGAFNPRRR